MYARYFKRLCDILGALVLLPLVGLVWVLVAPIIYLTDRGPVFYVAPRAGKGGRPFRMLKFRSMRVNAPDIRNPDGSTFNSNADPRVTWIGRLLRKTSLDELPQILNVLKGDMSFIGPRPILFSPIRGPLSVSRLKRMKVRPGLTGYSQAFFRNSARQEEKFMHDCFYVDNLTFALDLRILAKTVATVLRGDNVYADTPC